MFCSSENRQNILFSSNHITQSAAARIQTKSEPSLELIFIFAKTKTLRICPHSAMCPRISCCYRVGFRSKRGDQIVRCDAMRRNRFLETPARRVGQWAATTNRTPPPRQELIARYKKNRNSFEYFPLFSLSQSLLRTQHSSTREIGDGNIENRTPFLLQPTALPTPH